MKKIAIILCILTAFVANSQNNSGTSTLNGGFRINTKTMKAHPFLLNEWVIGQLVDYNGKLSERKLLNYDLVNNNPTYKTSKDQKDIMTIDSSPYSGFVLVDKNQKKYLFSKIDGSAFKKTKKETKFYQLINAPSKKIILESRKKLKDPNASGWYSSSGGNNTSRSTEAATYNLLKTLYVLNKAGEYVKVKLSASSVAKALKSKKKEIRRYIKQNNIKIKKAEDLIPVVEYYYSL